MKIRISLGYIWLFVMYKGHYENKDITGLHVCLFVMYKDHYENKDITGLHVVVCNVERSL